MLRAMLNPGRVSTSIAATGRLQPVERLEDPFQLFRRDAGTLIAECQGQPLRRIRYRNFQPPAIFQCVVHQIGQAPLERSG